MTPSRLMSPRSPRASTIVASTLPARPKKPSARTGPASSSTLSEKRPIASIAIQIEIATSAIPLTRPASTSARCSPKVRRAPPARAAIDAAVRPSAIAPTSERTWPASASRASEPVMNPPTASATSMTTLIASANSIRRRESARRAAIFAPATPWACAWSCIAASLRGGGRPRAGRPDPLGRLY